jgi:hypothetical protein
MDDVRATRPFGRQRPGPVYDGAIRAVLEGSPKATCHLLGIPITTDDGAPVVLSASFSYPVGSLNADLVMRVGPDRLVHVEYERRLSANEMVARMVGYRGVIQRRHQGEVLTQYLVVLRGGRVRGFIDPVLSWFWRRLGVIFLRDLDPEVLFSIPDLVPLAVLARGTPEELLLRSLAMIRKRGDGRGGELHASAITLAELKLSKDAITRVLEEVEMTPEEHVGNLLWQTKRAERWKEKVTEQLKEQVTQQVTEELKEQVTQQVTQQLKEQVKQEFLAEALQKGREQLLISVIEDRFGPHSEASEVAHRLLARSGDAGAVQVITGAADFGDVMNLSQSFS